MVDSNKLEELIDRMCKMNLDYSENQYIDELCEMLNNIKLEQKNKSTPIFEKETRPVVFTSPAPTIKVTKKDIIKIKKVFMILINKKSCVMFPKHFIPRFVSTH